LDRKQPRPYDSLQWTEILNGIRIEGGRIEKMELQSGTRERKVADAKKIFCQRAVNPKKWQI